MPLDSETVKSILKEQHEEQKARDEHGRFTKIQGMKEAEEKPQAPFIMGMDTVEDPAACRILGLPDKGK